jgi:hypothetical protein
MSSRAGDLQFLRTVCRAGDRWCPCSTVPARTGVPAGHVHHGRLGLGWSVDRAMWGLGVEPSNGLTRLLPAPKSPSTSITSGPVWKESFRYADTPYAAAIIKLAKIPKRQCDCGDVSISIVHHRQRPLNGAGRRGTRCANLPRRKPVCLGKREQP